MDFDQLPNYQYQVFVWNGKKHKVADLINQSKYEISFELHINELKFKMTDKVWLSNGKKCSPNMVVHDLNAFPEHMRRILKADLNYPILITNDGHIIDGYHRIAKANLLGITKIKCIKMHLQ